MSQTLTKQDSIDDTASLLQSKMSLTATFPVTIEASGNAFQINTSDREKIGDLFRSIAIRLQVSEYRFGDRFILQFHDRSLHEAEDVQSCGIKSGSRLHLSPRLSTGLKSSPATRREVKKAIEALVDGAMQNGEINDENPVTLVTQVGNQQIAVQISPVGSRRSAAPAPPIDETDKLEPADVERLLRQKVAEQEDRFKEEAKKKREHERESEALQRKLDELRKQRQLKRRRNHSGSSDRSSPGPTPTPEKPSQPASPVPATGFAGLRRGFLLQKP